MFRKLFVMVLCLGFLAVSNFAFASDVYITQRGKRFHTEDCRLVANKQTQAIDKDTAVEKGLTPCAKCFKAAGETQKSKVSKTQSSSISKEDVVYATARGKKYHEADCRSIKNKDTFEISVKEAQAKGLEPCRRCFLKTAKAQ